MELLHLFKTKSHDLVGLFEETRLFSTFMRKLERQALIDPIRYDPQKYVGDGFELFVELFLKLHPCDNRVGVYNYVPVQENDNGVDGIGINIRDEKSVVQVKYRSNTQSLLTANEDHLSNMFSDGMLAHNVVADMENKNNFRHFVFTTAEGLHFYTDLEMFKSKVYCIANKDFRSMLDNNVPFWNKALDIVKFNIKQS
jgi:hypothetical protein